MTQISLYFNTTNLTGQDLMYSLNMAKNQNDKILMFFRKHRALSFSPSEVHREIFTESVPITSVRRSITNLTKANDLIKTDKKVMGVYGKLEYTWIINN